MYDTDLSALLEDVTVPLVVVARRARLGVHSGHLGGRPTQLEGGDAGPVLARLLAAQLARLGLGVAGCPLALARLHAVGQADGAGALALVAHKLLVAHRLVGLHGGDGAGGTGAVTEALVPAPVVVAALVAALQLAFRRAARAL